MWSRKIGAFSCGRKELLTTLRSEVNTNITSCLKTLEDVELVECAGWVVAQVMIGPAGA